MIHCAGSIDGCHIPITPPAMKHSDYYNRKGWYFMLLQAVVDHSYLFNDVCVGLPGSVHDARALVASQQKVLCGENVTISGTNVPIFIVGDSAYPLSTWLMYETVRIQLQPHSWSTLI